MPDLFKIPLFKTPPMPSMSENASKPDASREPVASRENAELPFELLSVKSLSMDTVTIPIEDYAALISAVTKLGIIERIHQNVPNYAIDIVLSCIVGPKKDVKADA